jgi:regulator of sigma D
LKELLKRYLTRWKTNTTTQNEKNIHSIIELSKEEIIKYNTLNYDLKDNNYVYPIFNIEFKKILSYLQKQFEIKDTLIEYYHHLQLSEVLNHKIDYHKLIHIIDNTTWWNYLYKNINNNFLSRKYKFQFSRIADIETRNKFKQLFKINDKTIENYDISDLNKFFDDISVIFKGHFKYHTNNITDICIENINNLIGAFNTPNFHIYIPIKTLHRIENIGTDLMEFTETQIGSYLGEDDIIRYEDDYNRR